MTTTWLLKPGADRQEAVKKAGQKGCVPKASNSASLPCNKNSIFGRVCWVRQQNLGLYHTAHSPQSYGHTRLLWHCEVCLWYGRRFMILYDRLFMRTPDLARCQVGKRHKGETPGIEKRKLVKKREKKLEKIRRCVTTRTRLTVCLPVQPSVSDAF